VEAVSGLEEVEKMNKTVKTRLNPRKGSMSHENIIKFAIKSELIKGYIYFIYYLYLFMVIIYIFEKRFV
jgi:hypothetical protein